MKDLKKIGDFLREESYHLNKSKTMINKMKPANNTYTRLKTRMNKHLSPAETEINQLQDWYVRCIEQCRNEKELKAELDLLDNLADSPNIIELKLKDILKQINEFEKIANCKLKLGEKKFQEILTELIKRKFAFSETNKFAAYLETCIIKDVDTVRGEYAPTVRKINPLLKKPFGRGDLSFPRANNEG